MVYASLACISVAMMSPIESFAKIKGERFRFHLQNPEIRNRKFSWSYSTEIGIRGRSWSSSNCSFWELGKTWKATKYKWLTFEKKLCLQKTGPARPGNLSVQPGPFLGTEFHGPARMGRAGPTGHPTRADLWGTPLSPFGAATQDYSWIVTDIYRSRAWQQAVITEIHRRHTLYISVKRIHCKSLLFKY